MDTLAKPVRMNPDMVKLLDKMRTDDQPYPVYQQPVETADEQVCAIGRSLVTDANLPFATRNQYLWYVRELARLFRTRYGRDLAFHMELVMRKWQTLGLSPNIMQIIACEIHNSLKPAEQIQPNIGNGGARPKGKSPQRHKDTKAEARDEEQSPKDKAKGKAESETRSQNDESGPQAGKDERQSPKDKASQKDEVRSPKDEANPQEGKSEVRSPNGKSSPKSEWPKAVGGERSAVGEQQTENSEGRTANSAAEVAP